jgi:hypothetical protein
VLSFLKFVKIHFALFTITILGKLLEKLELVIFPMTSKLRYLELISTLRPIDNGHELIRIGSPSDGGYLLPNDFAGVKHCISPGVSDSWSFELQLLSNFGINSVLVDASIQQPIGLPVGLTFKHLWVGSLTDNYSTTVGKLIQDISDSKRDDLILQMDIEGSEYSSLMAMTDEELRRFRMMVIEFHYLEHWLDNKYFSEMIDPLFGRILKYFDVVHLHANNGGRNFKAYGTLYPSGAEITFHRSDRKLINAGFRNIPNFLDAICDPSKPEIKFPFLEPRN